MMTEKMVVCVASMIVMVVVVSCNFRTQLALNPHTKMQAGSIISIM